MIAGVAAAAAVAAAASASIFFLNAARAASSRAVASISCTMSVAEMPRPLIALEEWRDTLATNRTAKQVSTRAQVASGAAMCHAHTLSLSDQVSGEFMGSCGGMMLPGASNL